MSRVHRVALTVAAFALSACGGTPAPVPVSGSVADVRALVGDWAGEYASDGLGRSGSITFTLAAHGDTARGDVVMIPRGMNQPLRPARETGDAMGTRAPDVLTINFVRVTGDQVDGSLAPYADPECGCTLYTSFAGRLAGNAISGTFVSLNAATGTMRQTGTWKVVRRRAP